MDIDSLAQALFGSKRAETQEVSTDGTTRTYTGVALTDSEDGTVVIDLGGDVTLPDDLYDSEGNVVAEWDGVGVEMPTSPQVSAGDDVIVTLMGGSATKMPMVTSSAGSGDRMRALVNAAQTVASAAQAVADAVNQHFFADTSGIHVTEATQEDWDESHTGANVLINSVGQLFRDGLNNLLTLTTQNGARALTIWDGLGNAAGNVLATFGPNETHLGLGGDGALYLARDKFRIHSRNWTDGVTDQQSTELETKLAMSDNAQQYSTAYIHLDHSLKDGIYDPAEADSRANATIGASCTVGNTSSSISVGATASGSSIMLSADTLTLDCSVSHVTEEITVYDLGNINAHTVTSNGACATASLVYFTLWQDLASWQNRVIGTLPVGYRPPTTVMVSPYCDSANHAGRCFVAFQADGDIRLYNVSGSTVDTGTHFTATATYVL